MANWMKEDEKSEKIIRGLLKLPENRRCINCNSLGPQYVCTTFLTFVCTNCSGVHREFTHRVKSVSMAKFSAEEVSALQAGGNERARQIYFKEWDLQRHSFPNCSNLHGLRGFIKHVYVDRKYIGDKSTDKLPRLKLDNKESYENRKVGADTIQQSHGQRSSPGGRNDNKSFRYYYDERRSPRYAPENSRYGGYRRSPVRFEVVDDRFREDGFGSGRRYDSRRFSSGESKSGSRSPDHQKNLDRFRSPDGPPQKKGDLPKPNDRRDADGFAHNQKIVTSSSTGSIDWNPVEHKRVNSGSLIDLSIDPEPPDAAAVPQTQQNGGNWPSSPSSAKEKASHAPNANPLESLLFQLSVPPVVPAGNMPVVPSTCDAPSTATVGDMLALPATVVSPAAPVELMPALSNSDGASITKSTTDMLTPPPNGADPNSNVDSIVKVSDGQPPPSMEQHQPSASPAADRSYTAQQTTPSVGALDDQLLTLSLASNAQGPSSASAEQQLSQAISKPAQDTSSGIGSQPLPVGVKSSERKELPLDLFTSSYSSVPAPVPGWGNGPPHGMGFGTQYYPAAGPVPAFPNSAISRNPFDLNNETIQAPTFPSMASLQGALPNVSASTGILPTSSLGIPHPQLMPPQSQSYSSAMVLQSPYSSNMSPSAYMEQQAPNNMPPPRIQDFGSVGSEGVDFGSSNTNQLLTSRLSAPATTNSFSSMGGNPFG